MAFSCTAVLLHLQKFWLVLMALEQHFGRPDGVELALEQRFGHPNGVKLALEQHVRWPHGVKVTLERRFGRRGI